ncbi:MAG: hypothetical protein FWC47_07285 [Oscillospiraceae bacterium]|nr:hypothetical protein [Oscillospiraceae bacterium]
MAINHKPPELLESGIDFNNKEAVQNKLKQYEEIIVDESIENAIVITKNGEVYRCYGALNRVYPDIDLGDKLYGASVTHNHPECSIGEYTFSDADINLYLEYKLDVLRGIDKRYVYELTRDAGKIDSYLELHEMTEYDGAHNFVIRDAMLYGIGYRRWSRE